MIYFLFQEKKLQKEPFVDPVSKDFRAEDTVFIYKILIKTFFSDSLQ